MRVPEAKATLGLPTPCTLKDVDRQWRRLTHYYAPCEANKLDPNEARFIKVQEANQVLKDAYEAMAALQKYF